MTIISYIKTHHPKFLSSLKSLRSFLTKAMENSTGEDEAPPQLPFDPLAPALPVSYPLKTLDELESKAYFKSFHFPYNKAKVKLQQVNGDVGPLLDRPRVLVCHDMAGGYTDDRYIQGGANPDAYAIWHWYLMDVFVYFSHSLVTLPPPCWTNTAHRHGVKVLGTFIMEWDEGKRLADKLLQTKESAQMYAERLTELALSVGFDGWLINMEVNLDAGQIPNLKEFVSHLSKTMHSSLPGSIVLWYDSVTIDGDLSWQNQLNGKNKPFFDICDGIFINYTWKEDYPKLSANVAGDRKFDVYMGIDVFGRGTYGGGQWTTDVALDVIKKDDVSAAIFAPGWVYETKQPPDFQTAQNRWWGLVEKSWGLVQNYPKSLPFFSAFDQGRGYHLYIDGEQVSSASWNNISYQNFQPFIENVGDPTIQVFTDFKEASYSGGGNIVFKGTLTDDTNFSARLFRGELLLGNSPVHFTYSVKSSGDSLLGLALEFSSVLQEKKSVFLASSGNALLTMNQFSSHFANVIMPHRVMKLHEKPGWILQQSSIEMNGHVLREISAVCYKSKHKISDKGDKDKAPSDYYSVLGHLRINTSAENTVFPPSTSWHVDSRHAKWIIGPRGSKYLSVEIIWQLEDGSADLFPMYNIYIEKTENASTGALVYLGVAEREAFYVSDLVVPLYASRVKFIIQVCGLDGSTQKLENAPFLILEFKN